MTIRDFCAAVETAALRFPDKAAVEDAAGTVTYRDLNAAADRIARGLAARGLAAGAAVGLFLPPGRGYVEAFLGVAKAGGVMMPLDTGVPAARLQKALARSRCTLVITGEAGAEALRERQAAAEVVTAAGLGVDGPAGERRPPRPEDPCYIMFTSGSTGEPRAVLGCHRGLSHFLRWEIGELGLDESERVSMLAPTTFDVSLRDMLVPLCLGGTLCIPDPAVRSIPHRLLAWLAGSGVTLTHIVPSLFRVLLAEMEVPGRPRPAALRHVLLAGEPLYGADVERWRRLMGSSATLVNLYGPTETTLAKAFFRIGDLDLASDRVVPIGGPLPDTALLVLDGGRLCAPGEIGEIHIKTPYRSLGYLDEPGQTARVFVDNPLNPGRGDVLYRTGDLGRYLPGRQVECLGRLDNQLKVNGVRIEPAEIESAVRRFPGIVDTVVVGHQSAARQLALTCYYVGRPEETGTATAEALRRHLADELPASHLPAFFVPLDELPYTVSGKVARRLLPRPEELLYENRPYRAPSGPVEEKLAAVWSEVLGLRKVGVDHPFTELGGDSLKAIRLTSGIYRELGVELSLKELYERGTIAALAVVVAQAEMTMAEPIPHLEPAPDSPVSHAQRRLWTLAQMDVDAVAYNLPVAFRIRGELDVERLRAALRRVVARHEALRTTFFMAGEELRQRVAAAVEIELPLVDLTADPDGEAAVARAAAEDRGRPFDLASGPLLRARLLRLAAREHVLLFNIHHIVCDVWSLGVMVRELRALYAAPEAELPPLRLQYRDFAAWQSGRLAAEPGDRDYWLGRLAGELPVLELPADFPRPPVQTFNGSTVRRSLGRELTALLGRRGESEGASPFVLLQAAVKALLFRLTGERRLIVGSPVLGRQHPDLEDQVGLYVNTLALDDVLEPALSFAGLVARVQRTTLDAFAHQAYPFDVLVDELPLERDMSHSPLFDVMVVFQEEDPEPLALPGAAVEPYGRENAWSFSRFDLVFHFMVRDGELILDLNYNSDLFLPARIERMAAQLAELAQSAFAEPQRRLAELDLLPAAERALIASFSEGPREPRRFSTLVEAFEAQAAATPRATALIHGEESLTYQELDERSNGLARFLLARSIGRGDGVAVAAQRSIGAMVALLGILKAGAAYVPVDLRLPRERLAAVLADSGCRLILTDGGPAVDGWDALPVAAALSAEPGSPSVLLDGQDLAYVLYTSGSTGTPKGVLVPHGGFVNMCLAQIDAFGITPEDRVLQFASASFDASLAEIFSALLSGATLVLIAREILERTPDFLTYVERHRVTVMTLPPVYLSALARAPMPSVRVLITAGEAAQADDARFYARSKACFNAYGPTESSVCATLWQVDPEVEAGPSIPIGRPLPNTSVYVLDERLHPVPIGVPGEIALAGPGLARGYHGQGGATAASFVPHPERDGERLYRTGDRGRFRTDGALEFLGRLDDQVKVLGHRIELGSIAAAMRALDRVGDVYVTPVDEGRALAAYFTPRRRIELWPSVAEFLVYDDVLYGSMAGDEERNRLYRTAFRGKLEGRKVVEIGPGAELVLSRLALEAGAEHVYAIEIMAETFERARARVRELGLEDRITLVHGDARTVEIGETVDYCISEIVGSIGGSEGAAVIINAARRFLADPTRMLPQRSVTRFAAVALPEGDFEYRFPAIAGHYVRRIFEQAGAPFDLRLCLKGFPLENVLSTSAVFEDLDFTGELALASGHQVSLAVTRAGEMSGFLVWLNLHVDEQQVVDILGREASWLPVYLPVFTEPVAVASGDVLDLQVLRRLCDDGIHPDYRLQGVLRRQNGETVPIDCESRHRPESLGNTPFYARLFPNGVVQIAPETDPEELRRELAARLPRHEIPACLVPLSRLPLNRSGKVDRRRLPAPFQAAAAGAAVPAELTALEARVAVAWREVLGREVGPDDNFFTLGGDSIKAIRIVSLLHGANVRLEVRDIFRQPTIRRSAACARVSAAEDVGQGPVTGEVAATPIGRWFFAHHREAPHHFNQSVILRAKERLQPAAVQQALAAVARHHDALRMRFPLVGGVRRGTIGDALLPVWCEEVAWDETDWEEKAMAIQASFDLDRGPLMRAVLVHQPQGDALWLLCHHLVVDAVSWGFLLADFAAAYRQAISGVEAVVLPPKTHSYQAYAASLHELDLDRERAYWQTLHAEAPPSFEPGAAAPQTCEIALEVEETARLLTAARRVFNGNANELLLTALGLALYSSHGVERCVVALESHGRTLPVEGLNVNRTVGWFTAFFPFLLDLPGLAAAHRPEDLERHVRHVQERLRKVPSGGISYGLLTYLAADPLPEVPAAIAFNYLGELMAGGEVDGLFTVDWDVPGPSTAPAEEPIHPINLLGVVLEGQLRVSLTCDGRRMAPAGAWSLLAALREWLSRLATSSLAVDTSQPVPADFTFSQMSLAELDQIVSDLPDDPPGSPLDSGLRRDRETMAPSSGGLA